MINPREKLTDLQIAAADEIFSFCDLEEWIENLDLLLGECIDANYQVGSDTISAKYMFYLRNMVTFFRYAKERIEKEKKS